MQWGPPPTAAVRDRLCPTRGESTAAFLRRVRPSLTTTHSWIQVHAPGRAAGRAASDERAALAAGQKVLSVASPANAAATMEQLLVVAGESGCATGKWMVFADAAAVDRVWGSIAAAVVAGQLDCSAKVSTRAQQQASPGDFLICVYVAACHDRDAVTYVLG
jgi:hypothetical protein